MSLFQSQHSNELKSRFGYCMFMLSRSSRVDDAEYVVVHVVASRAVGGELENLTIAHLVLLFVDLSSMLALHALEIPLFECQHTKSAPVTKTIIPPASLEG